MFGIGRPLDDFRRPQVNPGRIRAFYLKIGAAEHAARGEAPMASLASQMEGI